MQENFEPFEPFEPKIIAFVCNWCSYGGADQSGASRLPVPPEVRLIRVMCSGRVDPVIIIEALEGGADGVMIMGCHPGDCHYKEGNYNTLKRYKLLLKVMEQFGIDAKRVSLDWVSASEGEKFSKITGEFVASIRRMGPYIPAEKQFMEGGVKAEL